jgi:hypothetical protein
MNTSYLHNDWNEFEKLFPQAYAWLIAHSLVREKETLTAEMNRLEEHIKKEPVNADYKRWAWIKTRLQELNEIPY